MLVQNTKMISAKWSMSCFNHFVPQYHIETGPYAPRLVSPATPLRIHAHVIFGFGIPVVPT